MAIVQFVRSDQGTEPSTAQSALQEGLFALIRENLSTEIQDAARLAAHITQLVAGDSDTGAGGLSLAGLRKLFAFGRENIQGPQPTANRLRMAENRVALAALVRRTAMIQAANTASDTEPATFDETILLRDEMATALEEEASQATDDTAFRALMDVRAGVVQDLTIRAADLSRLESHTPTQVSNVLVMAYELYGDATRDQEITDRNGLAMPGFIPVRPLQVMNQ